MKNKLLLIALFCILQISINAQIWQKVVCGGEFTVALRSDSTLWAWGFNGNGQLGIGNLSTQQLPVQIGNNHNWKDIVAGGLHCLAIKTDGTLWAWGLNGNGQLGNATNANNSSPIQIGSADNWGKISAGQVYSASIKTNGTLWCWGQNYYGQLGNGSTADKNIPTQVGTDTNWKEVSCGGLHTLAIKLNGTLWAWGFNGDGQMGDSSLINTSIPKQIGTDSNWVKVSGGFEYSLGLKSDGSIWAWGFNGVGQLGIGANNKLSNPTAVIIPVQIGSEYDWKTISAGSSFAFAIKNDSSLWAWGLNMYGQLGNGNTIQQNFPVKIGSENNWKDIAAATGFLYSSGVYGLHSMGIKYQNDAICAAGANYIGQLGNGTTIDQNQFDCSIGTTSISENSNNNSPMVYPNPASEIINFDIGMFKDFQLLVYNQLGQVVLEDKLTQGNNTINISNLKKGIYFYKLQNTNEKTISGKFVKE